MLRERREIGVMIAIGESRRRLAVRAMMIAAALGVLGSLIGLGLGRLLGALLVQSVPDMLQGMHTGDIRVASNAANMALAGFMGPLANAASALAPALTVMRLQPVAAMRVPSPALPRSEAPGSVRILAFAGAAIVIAVLGARIAGRRCDAALLPQPQRSARSRYCPPS
ncbi:MAG: FtsX-like permease family protein [Burkholderiales bacterium]|nr:FtsX-like permease family protein [Burkholderiales bacterium]